MLTITVFSLRHRAAPKNKKAANPFGSRPVDACVLRFLALEILSHQARVTWPLPPIGEAVRKGERELIGSTHLANANLSDRICGVNLLCIARFATADPCSAAANCVPNPLELRVQFRPG
jgi:hypothetical protein